MHVELEVIQLQFEAALHVVALVSVAGDRYRIRCADE
jgi:hypothetical protein